MGSLQIYQDFHSVDSRTNLIYPPRQGSYAALGSGTPRSSGAGPCRRPRTLLEVRFVHLRIAPQLFACGVAGATKLTGSSSDADRAAGLEQPAMQAMAGKFDLLLALR